MSTGSTNPSSKEHLDGSPIGTAITEAPTDASDAEDSLKEENDLIKKLFKELDSVIKESCPSLNTGGIIRVSVLTC